MLSIKIKNAFIFDPATSLLEMVPTLVLSLEVYIKDACSQLFIVTFVNKNQEYPKHPLTEY